MRVVLPLLSLAAFAVIMVIAGGGLPRFGDAAAPAATHVSDDYIANAYHDAHTPNIVTVMIADYRGFDTLGETMVVFAAGLACSLLLLSPHTAHRLPRFVARKQNLIAETVTRIMLPLIQLFAMYVIFHGHYSPGGGFQGGALLAGSVLVARVVIGWEGSQAMFPSRLAAPLGALGLAVYAGMGLVPLLLGGSFLEYDVLPIAADPALRRYWGIFAVEIGVALTVTGTLVSIFDDLSTGAR